MCDGLVGGAAPFLAIYLVHQTKDPASFAFLFLISTIISLAALNFVKDRNYLPEETQVVLRE